MPQFAERVLLEPAHLAATHVQAPRRLDLALRVAAAQPIADLEHAPLARAEAAKERGDQAVVDLGLHLERRGRDQLAELGAVADRLVSDTTTWRASRADSTAFKVQPSRSAASSSDGTYPS